MSYVITIQRSLKETPLTRSDINAVLDSDVTIQRKDAGTAEWTRSDSAECIHFNIEDSSLWTDSYHHSEVDTLLTKLHDLALILNAEVIGEEGEVLTSSEQSQSAPTSGGLAKVAGLAFTLVSSPFMVILFVIRVPYMLWQIFRATR